MRLDWKHKMTCNTYNAFGALDQILFFATLHLGTFLNQRINNPPLSLQENRRKLTHIKKVATDP